MFFNYKEWLIVWSILTCVLILIELVAYFIFLYTLKIIIWDISIEQFNNKSLFISILGVSFFIASLFKFIPTTINFCFDKAKDNYKKIK